MSDIVKQKAKHLIGFPRPPQSSSLHPHHRLRPPLRSPRHPNSLALHLNTIFHPPPRPPHTPSLASPQAPLPPFLPATKPAAHEPLRLHHQLLRLHDYHLNHTLITASTNPRILRSTPVGGASISTDIGSDNSGCGGGGGVCVALYRGTAGRSE
jgi:hypothetical protein